MIWNSSVGSFTPEIKGQTFDMAPTILRALGVNHDYVFPLGEDLYSRTLDHRRLVYNIDQEKALNMYVKLKSVRPVNLPQDITVRESPDPLLGIGEMFTPLVINRIIVDLPGENDILKLMIPENYKFSKPEILSVGNLDLLSEEIRKKANFILVMKNSPKTADFFKIGEKNGYLLGVFLNGKKLIRCAPRMGELSISADEIRKLMEAPLR